MEKRIYYLLFKLDRSTELKKKKIIINSERKKACFIIIKITHTICVTYCFLERNLNRNFMYEYSYEAFGINYFVVRNNSTVLFLFKVYFIRF